LAYFFGSACVQDARADNFEESLKSRVRSALDTSLQMTSCDETNEDLLTSLVSNSSDLVFTLVVGHSAV